MIRRRVLAGSLLLASLVPGTYAERLPGDLALHAAERAVKGVLEKTDHRVELKALQSESLNRWLAGR